jgi:hypothetical protein
VIADRELWQQARTLFDELVELGPGPRGKRLEEIGRTDPVLRGHVERLLTADPEAEAALRDFSFGPPPAVPDDETSHDPLGIIGRTVSHFRSAITWPPAGWASCTARTTFPSAARSPSSFPSRTSN